ncbi:hypothetical protein ABZP36_004384, partial [Zizania latifolia]
QLAREPASPVFPTHPAAPPPPPLRRRCSPPRPPLRCPATTPPLRRCPRNPPAALLASFPGDCHSSPEAGSRWRSSGGRRGAGEVHSEVMNQGLFHGHSYVLVCADFGGFQ